MAGTGERGDEENAQKGRGGAIGKEKEQCPVLLSRLSVAGGEEQRGLVGRGVSHVCLTLSDSLLCYSLAYTPGDVRLLCNCPLSQPPPESFTPLTTFSSIPPRRQVGWEQVKGGAVPHLQPPRWGGRCKASTPHTWSHRGSATEEQGSDTPAPQGEFPL